MTAPVLKDIFDNDFTEGDRVVHSTSNGVRVGKVDFIKEFTKWNQLMYKVYIDLSEHHNVTGVLGKMYAKRQGYEYSAHEFVKIENLTSTGN